MQIQGKRVIRHKKGTRIAGQGTMYQLPKMLVHVTVILEYIIHIMYSYSTRPCASVTHYTHNNDQRNYFSSTTTKFVGFENK